MGLPWCLAGGARTESLQTVALQLEKAKAFIDTAFANATSVRYEAAIAQKIMPFTMALAAMRGEASSALEQAEAWKHDCSRLFSENTKWIQIGSDAADWFRGAITSVCDASGKEVRSTDTVGGSSQLMNFPLDRIREK